MPFYKKFPEQFLWHRWTEEWVVLYDDSTMAWFTVIIKARFFSIKKLFKQTKLF